MTKRIYSRLLIIGFLFISLPGMFAQIAFTNRTAELLANTDFHSGVAIAVTDMNGDFLDDIIHLSDGRILNIEYQVPNGQFTNYEYGTVSNSSEWSMCVADVDNNGYCDVITGGFYNDVKLFTASDDGSSYSASNLPGATIFSQASNFADIDNDGAVDVFVCHDDGPSRIWHNDGTGNFSMGDNMINLAIFSGIENNSGNYGSVWTDFDSDGDLDLYIAKCRQGVNDPTDPRRINQLWINDGNNNYTEVAAAWGLDDGGQSWTTEFADIDNDGDFDALVTNHDVISKIYENIDNTSFVDITASSGLNISVLTIQGIMKDFDNDGYVDIIIAGSDHEFWRNNGDKTFTELANPFDNNNMESYAIGDLNHDGFLDVYAGYANIYTTPSNIEDAIWINDGNANNWFGINTVGTTSNRSAVGARIELYGDWGIQVREVRAGESYGIVNSFAQNFGLGLATSIDSVIVHWPSGLTDKVDNPAINEYMTIIENTCVSPAVSINIVGSAVICNDETVTLEAPAGYTDYEWSTGETTQSIDVALEGAYTVRVEDGTGCFGISEPILVQENPDETPEISASGETDFCLGGTVTLTSTEGLSYSWSTGETTQSIDVSTGGAFFVQTEGQCGIFTSELITIDVYDVDEPVTTDQVIGSPQTVTLMATGDNLSWYTEEVGGIFLGNGNSLDIPLVDATTTFWVENLVNFGGAELDGGLAQHVGASNYSGNNFNAFLIFDVLSPFILRQVKVYTDTPGMREVQLFDGSDNLVQSIMVMVPSGESYIDLNFDLGTVGNDYYLTTNGAVNLANFGFESPRLRRSNSGVNYPYITDDVVNVKNSNFGTQYYYYFFDWQIEVLGDDCISDRVPLVVTLDPSVSIFNPVQAEPLSVFPNPTSGQLTIELNAGLSADAQLEVIDLNGRTLISRPIVGQNGFMQLNLDNFAKGLYFVRIQDGDQIYRTKVALH